MSEFLQAVRDQNGQLEGQNRTLQFVVFDAQGRFANAVGELDQCERAQEWTPLATTTTEEVLFLAPLDPVNAG